ncbi:glutamine-hydrolyzing carbamoyl-phosphate synthase small subunit [Paenalcaligenes sp.]|uniref:glutamine-hydrolyzing carbamoyl-phosphate synthase small subunit n=1 Tax=Paenalcaligenes sp. TaxID=1966342 RepID=UPI002620113C|nr:glutamine-hydrolyzing carbamoyl-phosphate synthase small subunit [Paenalcaligenes sp.]
MLPSLFPDESNARSAILALADGTIFKGYAIGAEGYTVAEVVFNTSMTGYQEILTDPSYKGQIVTLTYPHIGNTGVNPEDAESEGIQAAGLVVRDCALRVSNFRSTQSLPDYLKEQGVVAIAGVDTRKLTRILREKGAQSACILVGDDTERAIELARSFAGLEGVDLVKEVSTSNQKTWTQGSWQLGQGFTESKPETDALHVVAYDFGVKANILRLLADRGCRITVVPAQTSAEDVLALNPDGVFLSNGPGDPAACDYAITATQTFLDKKVPLFGICLGHQLLGLAAGAQSVKMKTGHHGANHPVKQLDDGRVFITSQNHGFAIDADSLPANVRVTHVSLFDGSLQGLAFTDRPAFGFQGHPEATPGPRDMTALFDQFISLMANQQA